jgi:glycosyltransferase involved in cell wall biosynthesis
MQIACSEYEKSTYIECLKVNPREIKVVHNTTDLSDGYQCLSEAEQVAYQSELGEEGHPKVICVSRLIKRKGQEVLLRALLEVAKRFGDVKLWLVGEGEHRQALEQLCTTMGLARHVRFLGLRSDVKRLLQMADIFVFPTLHEPFGIVLAEAMAARLPCIASRTGAIPEIIEEGVSGLTFTPGSSEELAHCIIQLADEPELCKLMGQRGRQIVEARFDARKAAAAYEQIYLEAYARQVLAR